MLPSKPGRNAMGKSCGLLQIEVAVLFVHRIARALENFGGSAAPRIRPAARNSEPALRTRAVLEAILLHVVPRAPNQQRAARRATRMRPVAEDISFVHIVQPRLAGDGPRLVQRFGRSLRLVAQLEIGMKRGEV